MSERVMTEAEAAAYNEGVRAALDLAARTALRIESTSKRPLYEGFAIAALQEFAASGAGLLLIRANNQRKVA